MFRPLAWPSSGLWEQEYKYSYNVNLMFVSPCIIDINNVEDQLDTTVTIYWYSNQLNMFRAIFSHPQERKALFYSMWYNAPKLLPAGGLEQLGCIVPHAVKHSLALLRMGKKMPETCWADWNINKLLLLHLIVLLNYLCQWCTVKQTSNLRDILYYISRKERLRLGSAYIARS